MSIEFRFTEYLEDKRKELGHVITYREMAEMTGLSLKTIWKLHHDQAGKYEVIDALCKFFGRNPGDFLKYIPDNNDHSDFWDEFEGKK